MDIKALLWGLPSARMGWRNLGRNRVRSALAVLGIVIGVVAIASLGMAGAALSHQATSNLAGLANEVTVTSGQDNTVSGVTTDQVDQMRRILPPDATVIPQKTNRTTISQRGQQARVSVTGVTEASALYDVSAGEAPDRLTSGALVSNNTAQQIGLKLGDPVSYHGSLYRVRGFIDTAGGFGPGFGGGQLVLPISALRDQQYYDTVTVKAESGEEATRLADQLDAHFNKQGRKDEEVLRIQSFGNVQANINSFLNTLNLALLGIGSISLFVASVAILNVMLMSTIERRGEIGVLRAVGIRRGEVLRMILTEAVLLGVVGGIVGVVLSLGAGLVLFQVLTGDASLVFIPSSMQNLLVGFGFAVFASLVSGIYPAWKAANDRPVEALRG